MLLSGVWLIVGHTLLFHWKCITGWKIEGNLGEGTSDRHQNPIHSSPGHSFANKSHQNPFITFWDILHTYKETYTHKIRILSGGNNLKLLITYRSSCMTVSMVGLPRVSGSTKHSRALDSANTANTRDGKANQYFRCQVYTHNTVVMYFLHGTQRSYPYQFRRRVSGLQVSDSGRLWLGHWSVCQTRYKLF